MEFVGTFLGKKLFLYDPKIECSESDFQNFVSQFNRVETLRLICSISAQLFGKHTDIFKLGEVPVREDVLYDFAYRVIKYCDESSQLTMSDDQFELALKMCHKLFDATFHKSQCKDAIEILTKISYRQFIFQQKNFNFFARNYYLYTDLWGRVASARSIDIASEIEDEIGVPYDYALLFAYALAGNKNGHFWVYTEDQINSINDKTNLSLTVESHRKFIRWCSGSYTEIICQNNYLPPFVRYPIIETKTKPVANKGEVFMIVSQQFLHDKLTSGLYYCLIDRFNKGSKNNKFKELFGYVFQEYIGELLRFYFSSWKIVSEIRYKKGPNHFQDSVDWFVIKDEKLIMIEVKQSSIFLKSKQEPSTGEIISDLRKTIIHAVNQLKITEDDIEERKYPELHLFDSIKKVIKLIVVNDPLFNANFIVKNIVKDEITDLTFQVININDFETLLSCQKMSESLFDILYYKAIEHNEMDFNELICNLFPDAHSDIDFLKPTWDRFFQKKLNIE